MYEYLFEILLSIILGIYTEELLDYMVILFLTFWEPIILFCIAAALFYVPMALFVNLQGSFALFQRSLISSVLQ